VPACTLSRRPPGGVSSFHRTFSSSVLLCTYALARCPLGRAPSESSVILVSSNSKWSSFLCAPHACAQCPLGRAPTESSVILSTTVFSYTALPPEVFSNLTGLLPELLTSVLCLSTSLSDSSEFRSASSVHWYSESATLCHTLLT
jgi:hypothetical protein